MPRTDQSASDTQTGAMSSAHMKFKCKVGGEWKPLDAFSSNQQRLIKHQLGNRRTIDYDHTGMTCREHTSKQRSEIRCDLCGLMKHTEEFSRTSKRQEATTCKRCTAWTETQEPEVTPAPLETGHVSVEEQHGEVWNNNFYQSGDFFWDEDNFPKAPITCLEGLGLTEEEADMIMKRQGTSDVQEILRSLSISTTPAPRSNLPPHLSSVTTSTTGSVASVPRDSAGIKGKLPPHLRYANNASSAQSVSTATTIKDERFEATKARQINYNAWDHRGVHHRAVKDPTVVSSGLSASGASNTHPNAEEIPAPNSTGQRGRGKWPKSSEFRAPQAQLKRQPTVTHVSQNSIDPDIDKQRRLNFCDSDDEDYGDSD